MDKIFKDKRVIIFDLDGTLIDSIGMWNDVDEMTVKILSGYKAKPKNIGLFRDEVLANCKTKDIYLEYSAALKEKYNLEQTPKEILDFRWDISDDFIKKQVDYKLDADKVLYYLKSKGFILALATTTTNIQLDAYRKYNKNIMDKAKLDDIFSVILSKDDILEKKPNPEVHLKIIDMLNVKEADCLVIEDSLVGVKAAKNANIDVITIYDKYSDKDREEMNKISKMQFDNFNDLLNFIEKELSN